MKQSNEGMRPQVQVNDQPGMRPCLQGPDVAGMTWIFRRKRKNCGKVSQRRKTR